MNRKLSRQEIERRKAAQISPQYLDLAERAAERLTDDYVRRWSRLKKLGPTNRALFEEASRLSERIFNSQVAVDIFEHLAAVRRPQILRTPGKRQGAHDPDGDIFLLACYDAARNGELPGQTKPWSKAMLAHQFNRTNPERWGTVSEIERRLTRLINERNKRTKLTK